MFFQCSDSMVESRGWCCHNDGCALCDCCVGEKSTFLVVCRVVPEVALRNFLLYNMNPGPGGAWSQLTACCRGLVQYESRSRGCLVTTDCLLSRSCTIMNPGPGGAWSLLAALAQSGKTLIVEVWCCTCIVVSTVGVDRWAVTTGSSIVSCADLCRSRWWKLQGGGHLRRRRW